MDDAPSRPVHRSARHDFRWDGVDLLPYKEDDRALFKAITRQTLFSHPDLDGDWSYETDGGSEPHRTVAFDTPGHKRVGVRVTDAGGDVSETRLELFVDLAPPVADFDFSPAAPLVDETVTFSISSPVAGS